MTKINIKTEKITPLEGLFIYENDYHLHVDSVIDKKPGTPLKSFMEKYTISLRLTAVIRFSINSQ